MELLESPESDKWLQEWMEFETWRKITSLESKDLDRTCQWCFDINDRSDAILDSDFKLIERSFSSSAASDARLFIEYCRDHVDKYKPTAQ